MGLLLSLDKTLLVFFLVVIQKAKQMSPYTVVSAMLSMLVLLFIIVMQ